MATCSAIDLTKAFDSIFYNLLLGNLHAYGVSQGAMEFLQSYLSNRQQRVKVKVVLWRKSHLSNLIHFET